MGQARLRNHHQITLLPQALRQLQIFKVAAAEAWIEPTHPQESLTFKQQHRCRQRFNGKRLEVRMPLLQRIRGQPL